MVFTLRDVPYARRWLLHLYTITLPYKKIKLEYVIRNGGYSSQLQYKIHIFWSLEKPSGQGLPLGKSWEFNTKVFNIFNNITLNGQGSIRAWIEHKDKACKHVLREKKKQKKLIWRTRLAFRSLEINNLEWIRLIQQLSLIKDKANLPWKNLKEIKSDNLEWARSIQQL